MSEVTMTFEQYNKLLDQGNVGTPEGKIHEAIAAIMAEIGGVQKGRVNPQQGYKFRGVADIYLACQPLMAKHGVHVTPHRLVSEHVNTGANKSGTAYVHIRQTIEFRFYHADGSWFPCVTTGEAIDYGDKTSQKVMSASIKYALIQTFAIPEEDPDVDAEAFSPELGAPLAPEVRKDMEQRERAASAVSSAKNAKAATPPKKSPGGEQPAAQITQQAGASKPSEPARSAPAGPSEPAPAKSNSPRDHARALLKGYAAKKASDQDKGGMKAATEALMDITGKKQLSDVADADLPALINSLESRA